MMKNILILVIALLSGIGAYVSRAEVCLESPACISQLQDRVPGVEYFLNLLEQKKYKTFYRDLREKNFFAKKEISDDIDDHFRDLVWYYYLVARAPIYNLKLYQETEPGPFRNADRVADLKAKLVASTVLAGSIVTLHESNKIKESLKKQIVTRTILSYYVCMINQFKNAHEMNPWDEIETKKKRKSLRIGIDVTLEQVPEMVRQGCFGKGFITSRNDYVKTMIHCMEPQFMETLVHIFPGRYNDVKEYLLKAGYTEDEIPGLIDRTVGREASTDFLYRGKYRQENDKLLQGKGAKVKKGTKPQ